MFLNEGISCIMHPKRKIQAASLYSVFVLYFLLLFPYFSDTDMRCITRSMHKRPIHIDTFSANMGAHIQLNGTRYGGENGDIVLAIISE